MDLYIQSNKCQKKKFNENYPKKTRNSGKK